SEFGKCVRKWSVPTSTRLGATHCSGRMASPQQSRAKAERRMSIFIAGHRGMVGSAILRRLEAEAAETIVRTRAELDLLDQGAVRQFMQTERPDAVILAAAKVGGIHANDTYPADFISDNLSIQSNV